MLTNLIPQLLAQLPPLPPPTPGTDTFGWVLQAGQFIVAAFKAHDTAPAIGVLVMVLTWTFNQFFKGKISTAALPFVSAALGVLTSIAANLTALAIGVTPMGWVSAILTGLTTGAAASGFWSLIGKKVFGSANTSSPSTQAGS